MVKAVTPTVVALISLTDMTQSLLEAVGEVDVLADNRLSIDFAGFTAVTVTDNSPMDVGVATPRCTDFTPPP